MIVGRIPSNGAPSRANARVPTAWSAGTGYSIWAYDEALNLRWGQDAHETWRHPQPRQRSGRPADAGRAGRHVGQKSRTSGVRRAAVRWAGGIVEGVTGDTRDEITFVHDGVIYIVTQHSP